MYRTSIPAAELTANALLDVGHPVHDAATVSVTSCILLVCTRTEHREGLVVAITERAHSFLLYLQSGHSSGIKEKWLNICSGAVGWSGSGAAEPQRPRQPHAGS